MLAGGGRDKDKSGRQYRRSDVTTKIKTKLTSLPRCWDEDCTEITDGHGEEDTVGGGLHAGSAEDDDDDGVGDDGDPRQEGHHDTKQGEHKAEGSMGAGGVEGVTGAILNTSEIWH